VFICGRDFYIFVKSEIEIKTERLQKMLAGENLGGVLINAQHNFAWLTAGASNGVDLSRESGASFLLVRADGKRFALANNIEMPRLLAEEISAEDFEPVEFAWEDEKSSGDFVVEKAKSLLNDNSNLAADLVLSNEVRPIENLISSCRYELTEAEIERFKQLGKDAGRAIGSLFKSLSPGETELEIAHKASVALASYNIDAIVNLVGADERIKRFRHPIPTANVWKKVLLVVVCAKRGGLIASLSRIACVGEIPAELERRTEAASYVFAKLLSETKTGASGANLYRIAADAYREKGFAGEIHLHHQGGAAGYKTRDWTAHPASLETVKSNQAFAWNPSITGTKAEETYLLNEAGELENLTASPAFPSVSVEIGGREFLSPGILSL
jgi:Xaa-Pro dipeptidase